MKHYLLEMGAKFEMSEERAKQLLSDDTILECKYHGREFPIGAKVMTYHLTNGDYGLGLLDISALVRDVS